MYKLESLKENETQNILAFELQTYHLIPAWWPDLELIIPKKELVI